MSTDPQEPIDRGTAWWHPTRHADRRAVLLARMRIKSAVRAWFADRGFIEVETACLQVSPGNETHIHAFRTELTSPTGHRRELYLHTSPEFACKKLLAAGETKIFTFAPVFRNHEFSVLHHPEFTMLEWYEVGADYAEIMDQCHALLGLAANATGHHPWLFRGRQADPFAAPCRLTVAEAFRQHAQIDVLATVGDGRGDRDAFAQQAARAGIQTAPDDTWSDIFTRILIERIEPNLATGRATVLDAYPIPEAALARPSSSDARVAERFELYCCGVELANAFGEMTDPTLQRARFEADMAEKARLYGERYPIDEEFLSALADMPPASGCALGFDRLVMLATGAQRVDQVIWTPLAEVDCDSTDTAS